MTSYSHVRRDVHQQIEHLDCDVRQYLIHAYVRNIHMNVFYSCNLDCDVRYFIRHKYMFSTANCTVSRMMIVRSEAANVCCLHSARLYSKTLSDFMLFIYMYMPCASCTVILVSASLMFIADAPILTTRQNQNLTSDDVIVQQSLQLNDAATFY